MWGSAAPHYSGGAFQTSATVTGFPHSKVAGQGSPLLSSLAGLFIYSLCKAVPLPHSPELMAPHPLCYVPFFFQLLIYYSVFFSFFPEWRSVCPVGYADLSQGVPHSGYLLTCWSVSPKQVRSWHLVMKEISWFLRLMWFGDAMSRLGVWRCQNFASSWWFFLPGVFPASLQEITYEACFLLPPSSHHLGTSLLWAF
jgi:hypothetical protein